MQRGKIAREAALICALAMIVAAVPQIAGSAPPAHSQNDKQKDEAPGNGYGRGKQEDSNSAPTISGTPDTQAVQDTYYRFTPTASDADGDTLTFSVTNRPTWLAFDSLTGELSGTPRSGDVGTYENITIEVSDGSATAELPAFAVSVVPYADGSVTLSWVPPTENTDGGALVDLAGYRIQWRPESENYTRSIDVTNPGITTFMIENLLPGTYYFAARAINSAGVASDLSNEIVTTIAP